MRSNIPPVQVVHSWLFSSLIRHRGSRILIGHKIWIPRVDQSATSLLKRKEQGNNITAWNRCHLLNQSTGLYFDVSLFFVFLTNVLYKSEEKNEDR